MGIQIFASMLCANQGHLYQEAQAALEAGVDGLHIDVMDHHYVKNMGLAPMHCEALLDLKPKLEVHFMVDPLEEVLETFMEMPLAKVFVHPETCKDFEGVARRIKAQCPLGVVWHPKQTLSEMLSFKDFADEYLVMGVYPGWGGQKMLENTCEKVASLAQNVAVPMAVDGGVTLDNAPALLASGATSLVIGSAFFASNDYNEVVSLLHRSAT